MSDKIYVSGHRGMVGSAIVRQMRERGFDNLILRTRDELNLCDNSAVDEFFLNEKPDTVIVAAAKVGGIHANNTYPADFIYENLAIALNTIHAAYKSGVSRLLFLGSSCIYPREASQPMPEESLLSSALESTNEAYAIAKIASLKLCQYYRKQYGVLFYSAMPTNLYGPGDNYHPENSHVLPALIRRFHEAKEEGQPSVAIWGTGQARREFLHVDDLASGVLHLLQLDDPPDWINIGFGGDVTIIEVAELIKKIVDYNGEINFDTSKPDGTPRKLLDSKRIFATGWQPQISLEEGLVKTYQIFLKEQMAGTLRV
jgi:GDP-L-fucose synthase